MNIRAQFCEYKTHICINEVVELSNAFGVLVIHLDGKEVYVIYIYIFSFTYFYPHAFLAKKSTCSKLFSKLMISKIGFVQSLNGYPAQIKIS